MEQISSILALICMVSWYLYLVFGYGEFHKSTIKYALCPKHRDETPRFIRFILLVVLVPMVFLLLGYLLPVIIAGLLLLSPIWLIYRIVIYFVDNYTKSC